MLAPWLGVTVFVQCKCCGADGPPSHVSLSAFLRQIPLEYSRDFIRLESCLLTCTRRPPCFLIALLDTKALRGLHGDTEINTESVQQYISEEDPWRWQFVQPSGYIGHELPSCLTEIPAALISRLPMLINVSAASDPLRLEEVIDFDAMMATWTGHQLRQVANIEKVKRGSTSTDFATREWVTSRLPLLLIPPTRRTLADPRSVQSFSAVPRRS
jgi:hypothetical protein